MSLFKIIFLSARRVKSPDPEPVIIIPSFRVIVPPVGSLTLSAAIDVVVPLPVPGSVYVNEGLEEFAVEIVISVPSERAV